MTPHGGPTLGGLGPNKDLIHMPPGEGDRNFSQPRNSSLNLVNDHTTWRTYLRWPWSRQGLFISHLWREKETNLTTLNFLYEESMKTEK